MIIKPNALYLSAAVVREGIAEGGGVGRAAHGSLAQRRKRKHEEQQR